MRKTDHTAPSSKPFPPPSMRSPGYNPESGTGEGFLSTTPVESKAPTAKRKLTQEQIRDNKREKIRNDTRAQMKKLNESAEEAFVREVKLYTLSELTEDFNLREEDIEQWEEANLILSVEYKDVRYYPAFAFAADGKPLLAVSTVLQLFGHGGWAAALWFRSPHSYLDALRPLDVLATAPDRVVEAADFEVEIDW